MNKNITKEFITAKTSPSDMVGMYFKFNGTAYYIKQFVGFGEHRFVFLLENDNDKTQLFNLLVLRKKNSKKIMLMTERESESIHKTRKVYFSRNSRYALRERSEAYILEKNISEKIYNLFISKQYEEIVSDLSNKTDKTSYDFFMISLCYALLGDEKISGQYLEYERKIDCNFDFFNLRNFYLSKVNTEK